MSGYDWRGHHMQGTNPSPTAPSIYDLYNRSVDQERETLATQRVRNFRWRMEHGSTLIDWHTAQQRKQFEQINAQMHAQMQEQMHQPIDHQYAAPPDAPSSYYGGNYDLNPYDAFLGGFDLGDNSFQLDNIPLAFNALDDPILEPAVPQVPGFSQTVASDPPNIYMRGWSDSQPVEPQPSYLQRMPMSSEGTSSAHPNSQRFALQQLQRPDMQRLDPPRAAVTKQNRKKKQYQSAKLVFGREESPVDPFSKEMDPRMDMHELLPTDLLSLALPENDADLNFWKNVPLPGDQAPEERDTSRSSTSSLPSIYGSTNVSRSGSIAEIDADTRILFGSSVPQSRESSVVSTLRPEIRPEKPRKPQDKLQCENCKTVNTPLWRRDDNQNPLCNACGLFYKLHGTNRPLKLKTDVIKRRNRQMEEVPLRRRRRRAPKARQDPALAHPVRISPKPESPENHSPHTNGQHQHQHHHTETAMQYSV